MLLDSHKYISTQIEREIPQFIRIEYPYFVAFIKAYYEWMEQDGSPYHFIANTLNYTDVDRTSLEFLDYFGRNFLNPLPNVIYDQNNIATLVKNIEQYYSARGSEKAFEFLFRLFEYKDDADHDIEFYYPSYDMLRVSDGKWVNEKSIKIIDPPDDVTDWEAGEMTGLSSGAKAVVDEVKVYKSTSGTSIAEIFLLEYDVIHTLGTFICGEDIEIFTINEEIYTATSEKVFQGLTLTDAGKYYYQDQRIKVTNTGNGEDARVVTDYVSKGSVSSFSIVDGGSGYVEGDKIYADPDDMGSGCYGTVGAVDGSGAITEAVMVFGGHDYHYVPKIEIISLGGGSDAIIMGESDDIGVIETIEVRDFGINYIVSETTVTFNTMFRIYDVDIDFDIGETITGFSSGAIGTVEYWNEKLGMLSVWVTSGVFTDGEYFTGSRWGGTAYIYDQSTATGTLNEGCLCEYNGRYINMDGHISSLKYIQDSYFYQMFSYMIKSDQKRDDWIDYIKNTHPAGTLSFSYEEILSKYDNESYGGFISPLLDTTEFYKFKWENEQYHGGHIRDAGNSQIKDYKNIVIDLVININTNEYNKTGYCFGSEITIT